MLSNKRRTSFILALLAIAPIALTLAISLFNTPAIAGQSADWQLPADHYVDAKMPMHIVFPRTAEAAAFSYARNAHPGIRWEIPIVVQGGAWPFRYDIIDDGGAAGLAIGSELERTSEGGFITHRIGENYGRLWWDAPTVGKYEILVRVTDQQLNTIDVPVSLDVGTDGWLFVDADNGDDDNDGSWQSPFRTIERIHNDPSDLSTSRVYLSGVVAMDGNNQNGHFSINANSSAPRTWVGLPGGSAVLEAYEGRISLSLPDFYLANLEHRHRADYFPDTGSYLHMITAWGNTHRLTLHDVHFSRFHGVPVNHDLGNSSIIMFTDPDSFRDHVAVVNNRISGDNGIFTSAYRLRHSVFENNRAINANFITGEASTWAIFWMKRGNEFISVRANQFFDGNTWGTPGNLGGAMGLGASRNIEFAWNVMDTPWTAASNRKGALKLWTNSSQSNFVWTDQTPVWIYRNSIRRHISYEGNNLVNMPDDNVISENNVLAEGTWPNADILLNVDNLDQEDFFDTGMRLTGPFRSDFLGQYGAEIAEPDPGHVFADRFETQNQ